jgi:hypothetical protein
MGALDGGEWSASRSGRLTSGVSGSRTHGIERRVGFWAKNTSLCFLNPVVFTAVSQYTCTLIYTAVAEPSNFFWSMSLSRAPMLRPLSYFACCQFSHLLFCIFLLCRHPSYVLVYFVSTLYVTSCFRVTFVFQAVRELCSLPHLTGLQLSPRAVRCALLRDHELPFCAMLQYPWQLQTAPCVTVTLSLCLSAPGIARLAIKVWATRPGNRVSISCSNEILFCPPKRQVQLFLWQ